MFTLGVQTRFPSTEFAEHKCEQALFNYIRKNSGMMSVPEYSGTVLGTRLCVHTFPVSSEAIYCLPWVPETFHARCPVSVKF